MSLVKLTHIVFRVKVGSGPRSFVNVILPGSERIYWRHTA